MCCLPSGAPFWTVTGRGQVCICRQENALISIQKDFILYIFFNIQYVQCVTCFIFKIWWTLISSIISDRPIAPKKQKHQETQKLKKIITKAVNEAMEDDLRARALEGKKSLVSKKSASGKAKGSQKKTWMSRIWGELFIRITIFTPISLCCNVPYLFEMCCIIFYEPQI